MRYRTIKEALKSLKELDPKTSLSEFVIRKLAKNKMITSIKSGNKTLVDFDSLLAFLRGESVNATCIQLES